jgi:hypothetical protein
MEPGKTNDDKTPTFTPETARLINGYIRHNLTVAEHDELDEWVTACFANQLIFELLTEGLMQSHQTVSESDFTFK